MLKTRVVFFAAVILGSWLPLIEMEPQTVYLRGLMCNASEKFVYQNMTSRPKSYNRTFSSFTILGTAKKPIHDLFVRHSFGLICWFLIFVLKLTITAFFKYTTVYRDVMHTPNFDFCQIMKMGTTNMMIKQLLAIINSTELLHECPYQVTDMFIFSCSFYSFILSFSGCEILSLKMGLFCQLCRLVTTNLTFTSRPIRNSFVIVIFSQH